MKLFIGLCIVQCSICSLHAQMNVTPYTLPPAKTAGSKKMEPIRNEGSLPSKQAPPILQPELTPPLPEMPVAIDRSSVILDYWFGFIPGPAYFPQDKLAIWLGDEPGIDLEIGKNFTQDVLNARRGDYNSWRATPRGRLALIILLDQIPRRIYKDNHQAFSSDPMARGLVIEGIQKGDDRQLYPIERAFFYLPLEHAEDPATQKASVSQFRQLFIESPPEIKPDMKDFLDYALLHQQQIARFGRFPARNAILGRRSTPEETQFLRQARRSNL